MQQMLGNIFNISFNIGPVQGVGQKCMPTHLLNRCTYGESELKQKEE